MAQSAGKEKERGKFLTIMIVIMLLLQIQGFEASNLVTSAPPWFFVSVVSVCVVIMLSLYGIWMWKRWAVYLNIVAVGLGWIMSFGNFLTTRQYYDQISVIVHLPFWALYGLWFWALYRKWRYFE